MISQFVPKRLLRVIRDRAPLQVAVSGKVLDLLLRESGPSLLEGGYGDLRVTINYTYRKDLQVLRWNVTLRNEGTDPLINVSLTPLLLHLSVDPDQDYPRVRHLSGSYHYDGTYPPRAFRLTEERFATHDHCKSVQIGSTSASAHDHVPVLQFVVGRDENMAGFFVGFEWSSSWLIEAGWERNSFCGEPRPDFLIRGNIALGNLRLEPGESLEIPTIHIGFFEGKDWDSLDNALRRYVREELTGKLPGKLLLPPVSYDHWFGIHESFDVKDLKRQADCAAELGCEYFCLDAAWYSCTTFMDGVGNWYAPDPAKFPNGIEELSEHVRNLGMGFGLWHLIECAAPGTEVLKRHPELYYDNGQSLRHLRLDIPEGRNLALEILRKWIRDWNLTWMRWECSSPESWIYKIDPSGKLNLVYMKGFYKVIDTLRVEFPNLYIEGCQGGGQRLDWGMTVRTQGTWLSDHTAHPDICRFMQTGALRFWPAHFLNSAVRVHRNSGDSEATSHNLLSRMVGTMSFNGDIAQWSPAARKLTKRYVRVYKQIRHLQSQPVSFPLPQPCSDRDWDVVLLGDETSEELLLYIFRMQGPSAIFIEAPQGQWTQLLGSDKAGIEPRDSGMLLHLERNSSSLWLLRRAD